MRVEVAGGSFWIMRRCEVCGYEALSRFHDGTPPNEVIAEAHELGLGVALEEACIDVALESAVRLPKGPFLSLNIAPETVVAGGIDRMAPSGRSIVVEITEHTAPGAPYGVQCGTYRRQGVC